MNALDLLFPVPEACAFCERRAQQKGICRLCMEEMIWIQNKICDRCGRTLEHASLCEDCLQRQDTYFTCNRSAVHYNEKMKEIISLYKYRGKESLASFLAGLLEDAYRCHYQDIHFDAITYVPLHEKRLQERGFNQAGQLALRLSLHTKIPTASLLCRTRFTEKQSKKHRTDRLQTMRDAFEFVPYEEKLQRVLLIDDVYTTGTTINECARILARHGIIVYSLTVAR